MLQFVTAACVFVSGLGMGLVPIFFTRDFKFLKVFSGGIILGLSVIHVIPDGLDTFSEIIDYPVGGIFICGGVVSLILLNFILTWYAEKSYKHEHHKLPVNHECPLETSHQHSCVSVLSPSQTAQIVSKIGTSYIMEFGCMFHSLIIGLSAGIITHNDSLLITLMIALIFHQGFEGFALGTILSETKTFSLKKRFLMVLFYSIVTPLGICIGYGISDFYDHESYSYKFVEGSLNSFSGGLLLYVSLYNLLCEEFTQVSSLKSKFAMFGSVLLGIGFMAIIAIWN